MKKGTYYEIVKVMQKSFENILKLLNSEPTVSQTDDYEEEEDINESLENEELEPSRVEIEMVIKSLKNNKAAGED